MSNSEISVDGVEDSLENIKIADDADLDIQHSNKLGSRINIDGVRVSLKSIKIADDPDLNIRVVEYDFDYSHRKNRRRLIPNKAADFHVKKETLQKASPVFAAMLGSHWREGKQKVVELHEDTQISTLAMHVWFRILHGDAHSSETLEDVEHMELFHVFKTAEKYALKIDDAKAWFAAWWKSLHHVDLQTARELLFPCWVFQHTRAFAFVTKFVYNAPSYIAPYNPSPHKDLLLPDEILKQLNRAKAGLKETVQMKLREPMEDVLSKDVCGSKQKNFFMHQKRLMTNKIWPFEDTRKDRGIEELLNRIESLDKITNLEKSKQIGQNKSASGEEKGDKSGVDCIRCDKIDRSLQEAITKTRKKFDGLCLKCMEASDRVNDERYFLKERSKTWDSGCRSEGLHHGQNTWFHSYVGERPCKERLDHWRDKWDGDSDRYWWC